MRWFLIAAVWALAGAGGLWWAAHLRVGPVLFVVSERHGVHAGDLAAFAVAAAWATVGTLALLPKRRRR